jgi:hypothetical protein
MSIITVLEMSNRGRGRDTWMEKKNEKPQDLE